MSYCLLIKCVDGSLSLLSETPFDTRNEALDTLASYADTGRVDCATDQVWLIDLASVAPVVLVGRPAMGGGPVFPLEPEPEVALEPEAVIEVSPEPEPEVEVAEEPQLDVAVEPEVVEPVVDAEPEPEPSVDMPIIAADLPEPGAVFEPDAAFAPVPVPEPMVVPVLTDDAILPVEEVVEAVPECDDDVEATFEAEIVVEEAIGDDIVAEDEAAFAAEAEAAAYETPVVAAVAAAAGVSAADAEESILNDLVIPEPEPEPTANEVDSFSDLREALERSAAQMASEVSEAQAAVGSHVAETPVEDIAVAEGDAAGVSDDVDQAIELIADVADEPTGDEISDEPAVEAPMPEVAVVEDIECGVVIDADTALSSEVAEPTEPAEWPWAAKLPEIEPASESGAGAPVVPEVDVELPEAGALESSAVPAAEVGPGPVEPMSVTSGDETEIEFGGISEDYANLMQPVPVAVPEVPVATAVEPIGAVVSAELTESEAVEDEPSVRAHEDALPLDSSDPASATDPQELMVPAGAGAPGYTPDAEGVADLTCHDCVWVDTCPNKDQRDPASCGSFQWK